MAMGEGGGEEATRALHPCLFVYVSVRLAVCVCVCVFGVWLCLVCVCVSFPHPSPLPIPHSIDGCHNDANLRRQLAGPVIVPLHRDDETSEYEAFHAGRLDQVAQIFLRKAFSLTCIVQLATCLHHATCTMQLTPCNLLLLKLYSP